MSNKDTKRPHQPLSSGAGPVAPQPQIPPQVVQSKPPYVPPPPVHVPVPSLDSSQLLSSGFDPLAQFMNPHMTQSNTEPNPTITTVGAPVVPGLLNANTPTGQTPTETHPFLNQHPILPSPGVYTSGITLQLASFDYFLYQSSSVSKSSHLRSSKRYIFVNKLLDSHLKNCDHQNCCRLNFYQSTDQQISLLCQQKCFSYV